MRGTNHCKLGIGYGYKDKLSVNGRGNLHLLKWNNRPEALGIDEFYALHEGMALQNLNQLCHVSYSKHNGKEKVTMDDLFLLHNMDGGARVDVPWHVAKFFTDKGKGYKKKSLIMGAHLIRRIARSYGLMTRGSLRSVTLGPETSLLNMAKLVDLGICRYNGLGYGELVDDILDNGEDEDVADASNDDERGVRCHPNMSFTNRLRAMDKRLGEMETDISKLRGDIDDLTYVVSGMFERYDQFYGEFGQMKMEQKRFQTWNPDHLSQLLSYHHINHTRYDGTHYSYVPNIPNLRVQQGVNFMSSTPVYSISPSQSPSPNPFELFGDADA
ncbi:hypothetical protein Tco_1386736 [Tanacetum coccineum]